MSEAQVQSQGSKLSDSDVFAFNRVERDNGILDCSGFVRSGGGEILLVFPNGVEDDKRGVSRSLSAVATATTVGGVSIGNVWIVKNRLVVVVEYEADGGDYCAITISLQDAWNSKWEEASRKFNCRRECYELIGTVVGESVYLVGGGQVYSWQPLSSTPFSSFTDLDAPDYACRVILPKLLTIENKFYLYSTLRAGDAVGVYDTITRSWKSMPCPLFTVSHCIAYRQGFLIWSRFSGKSKYWDLTQGATGGGEDLPLIMNGVSGAIVI